MNKTHIIIAIIVAVLLAIGAFATTFLSLSSQNEKSSDLQMMKNDTADVTGVNDTNTVSEVPTPSIYLPTINIEQGGGVSSGITLVITQPQNGQSFTKSSVAVKGKTKARADIFVNEKETKSDTSGNFSVTVTLEEGDNPIVIVAVDSDGNYAESEMSVNYELKE